MWVVLRSGCWRVAAIAALGALAVLVGPGVAEERNASEEPAFEDAGKAETPGKITASGDPKRDKLIKAILRQLGRVSAGSGRKKDADDSYILAIGELNVIAKTADIQFQAVHGQQKSAEFLADYVLSASEGAIRQWQVVARVNDSSKAEELVEQARTQFDQQREYREKISAEYNAKAVRRC